MIIVKFVSILKFWVLLQKCTEDSNCKYFVYNHHEERRDFWTGRFRYFPVIDYNCLLLKDCDWEKLGDAFLEISYRKRGMYTCVGAFETVQYELWRH